MKTELHLYYGQNCPPCRALKPVLEQAAAQLGLPLVQLEAAANREAVMRLGFRAVPTVVLARGDAEQVLFSGLQSEGQIIEAVTAALKDA